MLMRYDLTYRKKGVILPPNGTNPNGTNHPNRANLNRTKSNKTEPIGLSQLPLVIVKPSLRSFAAKRYNNP